MWEAACWGLGIGASGVGLAKFHEKILEMFLMHEGWK
jgi:hypothetical protein